MTAINIAVESQCGITGNDRLGAHADTSAGVAAGRSELNGISSGRFSISISWTRIAWPPPVRCSHDPATPGVAGAACIISNKKTGRVDWVCLSGPSAEFRSDPHWTHSAPLLNVDVGWKRLSESLPDTILRKSEWYNDFVLSCGVRDILGARLVETSSHVATFGLHQQIGRRFADETAAIMGIVAAPLSVAMAQQIHRLFLVVVAFGGGTAAGGVGAAATPATDAGTSA